MGGARLDHLLLPDTLRVDVDEGARHHVSSVVERLTHPLEHVDGSRLTRDEELVLCPRNVERSDAPRIAGCEEGALLLLFVEHNSDEAIVGGGEAPHRLLEGWDYARPLELRLEYVEECLLVRVTRLLWEVPIEGEGDPVTLIL